MAQAARLGDGNLLGAVLTDEEIADTCALIALGIGVAGGATAIAARVAAR